VPGSEVSLGQLPQGVLLQLGLGQQALEPGVLSRQLLEPLGVVGFQAAVLGSPAMVGGLLDLQLLGDPGHILAVSQQPVSLP
jgi:hypothetical protein